MSRKLPTLLATLGLALAAAPAADAQVQGLPLPSDPVAAVPAGQVEHTVTTVKVEGPKSVPSHRRIEVWLSANRGHSVVRDADTGRLISDNTFTRTESRHYDADEKRLSILRYETPTKGLPLNAFTFESAVQKAYVEQGYVTVVGEKVVNGRRALITRSKEGKWRSDDATSVTTAVVDAETFRLYERTTVGAGGQFKQTSTYDVYEILPATSTAARARLAMSAKKGAKIVRRTRR